MPVRSGQANCSVAGGWPVKTGVRTPWKVTAVLAVLLLVRVGFAVGKRVKGRSVAAA